MLILCFMALLQGIRPVASSNVLGA